MTKTQYSLGAGGLHLYTRNCPPKQDHSFHRITCLFLAQCFRLLSIRMPGLMSLTSNKIPLAERRVQLERSLFSGGQIVHGNPFEAQRDTLSNSICLPPFDEEETDTKSQLHDIRCSKVCCKYMKHHCNDKYSGAPCL